jgi:hypothetical protein
VVSLFVCEFKLHTTLYSQTLNLSPALTLLIILHVHKCISAISIHRKSFQIPMVIAPQYPFVDPAALAVCAFAVGSIHISRARHENGTEQRCAAAQRQGGVSALPRTQLKVVTHLF